MSEYKIIKGFKIQTVAADPSTDLGQVWYNSTTAVLKYNAATPSSAVWASGGALNTARYELGSAGTQGATLAFGGDIPGGHTANSEEYNGTSWAEGNN